MKTKFAMTHVLRNKIKMFIKNRLDISSLIENIDIKNEDLSYAIIKNFNRVNDKIDGVILSHAVIGEKGKTTNLSGTKMRNCKFCDATFLGFVLMRHCVCDWTDFSGAIIIDVEYQYSTFYNCKFCETAMRIGTEHGKGAKFSLDFFKDLAKGWSVKIVPKSLEELKAELKEKNG